VIRVAMACSLAVLVSGCGSSSSAGTPTSPPTPTIIPGVLADPVSTAIPPSATAATIADPKALSLNLTDLATGWSITKGIYRSNADAAASTLVPVGAYNSHGRIISYESEMKKSTFFGLAAIDTNIIAYATNDGAHWGYSQGVKQVQNSGSPTSMGTIGDERVAFLETKKSNGFSVDRYYVILRRGAFVVELTSGGISATYNLDKVLPLVRLIDSRIQNPPSGSVHPVAQPTLIPTVAPTSTGMSLPVVNGSYTDERTGMTLLLSKPTTSVHGSQFAHPDAGKKFFLVYVVVTNNGSQPHDFSPSDFQVLLPSGETFDGTSSAPEQFHVINSTTIPVGEKRAGFLAFQVPRGTKTVTVNWDDNSSLSPAVEVGHYAL